MKSSFSLVFGDAAVIKVIDFFLDNQEFDYSITDIAKHADIGWSTLHLFWKDFVKLGIVKHTRKVGRAELYKLDIKNPLVDKILALDKAVSKQLMGKLNA